MYGKTFLHILLEQNPREWATRNLGEYLGCRDDIVSYDHYRADMAQVYVRVLDIEDHYGLVPVISRDPEEALRELLVRAGIVPKGLTQKNLENKPIFRRGKSRFIENENGKLELIWEE